MMIKTDAAVGAAHPPMPQTTVPCAEPGESRGDAAATNLRAWQALHDAIVEKRLAVAAPLDQDTILHASIRYYAAETLQEISHDIVGADRFGDLVAYLGQAFVNVTLAMDDGLSQGYTTTFRGRARANLGGHIYSYLCRCGFRAEGKRVGECWFELQPPPTLREVFE